MQRTYYNELPIPVQGVHAEVSEIDMPPTMLSDAENWVYRDGRLRVREGLTDFATTTSARVTGFAQWKDEADNVLVMTTTAKYFVWNNTTQAWTDLSGSLSGDETTHNVFRIFQQGSSSGTVTTSPMQPILRITRGLSGRRSSAYPTLRTRLRVTALCWLLNFRTLLGRSWPCRRWATSRGRSIRTTLSTWRRLSPTPYRSRSS
jgi:hypothetical protein